MIFERLFELLLSRRIDPFSDDPGSRTKHHCLSVRRYDRMNFFLRCFDQKILTLCDHCPDVIRCRTTASADHTGSCFYDHFHRLCKLLRLYIIISLTISLFRKSCIWLDNHRKRRIFQNLMQDRHHLLRSHPAVDPQCIHAQSFQKCNYRRYIRSGEQLSSLIKNSRHKHRKGCILFRCKYRCLQFIGVTHRLDMDQICSGLFSIDHHFLESFISGFKFQIPHRLYQLSGRTDIQRGIHFPVVSHPLFRRFLHMRNRRENNLF